MRYEQCGSRIILFRPQNITKTCYKSDTYAMLGRWWPGRLCDRSTTIFFRFDFYFFTNLSCPQNVTGLRTVKTYRVFRLRTTDCAGARFTRIIPRIRSYASFARFPRCRPTRWPEGAYPHNVLCFGGRLRFGISGLGQDAHVFERYCWSLTCSNQSTPLAVELFHDRYMRHRGNGSGTMPMGRAGCTPHDIARSDFRLRFAPTLRPSTARRHDQDLEPHCRSMVTPATLS
jgi:hypothetical protein